MAKPSIFSRDYEKRMRKRKIKIFSIIGIILIITGVLLYHFKIKDMDFGDLRNKLQAWVDSDNTSENQEPENQEPIVEDIKPVEPEKTYLELELPNKEKIKCEYITEDEEKLLKSIEVPKGYSYDISPNKKEVVILSNNQDMYLGNIDGDNGYKAIDITKKQYISSSGDKFLKEDRLEKDKDYIWHKSPKFIDDDTIIYVSKLPYFGASAKKEYAWIYNIDSKTEKIIWKLAGEKVSIGKLDTNKGIIVNIDGNNFTVNNKGIIVK